MLVTEKKNTGDFKITGDVCITENTVMLVIELSWTTENIKQ
jgi:hypothetical protein